MKSVNLQKVIDYDFEDMLKTHYVYTILSYTFICKVVFQFCTSKDIIYKQVHLVSCMNDEYEYDEVKVSSSEINTSGSRLIGAAEFKHKNAPFLVAINKFE